MEQAFDDLGFSSAEVEGVLGVVAAILALGNVEFRETRPDESEVTSGSKKWLDTAAKVLQVDPAKMGSTMVTRILKIRGQADTTCQLDTKEANDNAKALCKFIYARMFDWSVCVCVCLDAQRGMLRNLCAFCVKPGRPIDSCTGCSRIRTRPNANPSC